MLSTKFKKLRDTNILKLCSAPISNSFAKILDVGCGPTSYKFFKSLYKNYVGLDWIVPADIIQDLNKNPRLGFTDNYFDVIICTEVLEHLFYPDKVILELKRVLRTGGIAIISLPNEQEIWQRIGMLLGFKFKKGFDDIGGHRWYGNVDACETFVKKYFKIFTKKYVGFFIDGHFADRYGALVPWCLRESMANLRPNLFARQTIFYCIKN